MIKLKEFEKEKRKKYDTAIWPGYFSLLTVFLKELINILPNHIPVKFNQHMFMTFRLQYFFIEKLLCILQNPLKVLNTA